MALDITTRRGWGARTTRVGRPMGQVSRLVVHHFWRPDVPAGASRATERSVMRGVEAFHAAKDWSAAPGYTFVVFDSGRAYESTGWGRAGVHTAGINHASIALCVGNDGDAEEATPAAFEALHELQELGKARGHLTGAYNLSGHRDWAAKSCPGNRTYPLIGRVRSGNIPGVPGPSEEDDMITLDPPTRDDGQTLSLQVACNRALRMRHRRLKAEGRETSGDELATDDVMGPVTFKRANWLLDHYYHDHVSRQGQGTVTAGAIALIVGIEAIERDRLRELQAAQS